MRRTKRNKVMVSLLVIASVALLIYFLVFKVILGEIGQYIGGTLGFFIITGFISTASKSKQQLDHELKYMSTYHDNQRPRKL